MKQIFTAIWTVLILSLSINVLSAQESAIANRLMTERNLQGMADSLTEAETEVEMVIFMLPTDAPVDVQAAGQETKQIYINVHKETETKRANSPACRSTKLTQRKDEGAKFQGVAIAVRSMVRRLADYQRLSQQQQRAEWTVLRGNMPN